MSRIVHPQGLDRLARLAGAAALALPALAWAGDDSAPLPSCPSMAAEAVRAAKARREALDAGDNAWKTVLPFAVLVRKVSSRHAADEAQARLDALSQKARQAGCDIPEARDAR
jgi:hypothetical protein